MAFQIKHFSQLSTNELYDMLQLRAQIFVVEQDCVYNDLDGLDKVATHILCVKEGAVVGCARLLKPGTRFPHHSIGRLVVKDSERGTGLGIQLMQEATNFLLNEWKAETIKISAQKYLRRFYEELGFEVVTDEYLEDGIPHFGMLYQPKSN